MQRISPSYNTRPFRTTLCLPVLLLLVAGLALTGCDLIDYFDDDDGGLPSLPSAVSAELLIVLHSG